jgi:hypothetical protein
MKYLIPLILTLLSSCASTPEEQEAMRQFSDSMFHIQHNLNQTQQRYGRGGAAGDICNNLSVKPISSNFNCSFSCINGVWAEVC